MIILDTNVVSAFMKPATPREVIDWMDRQESANLYLTSITIAEILYGIAILPMGNRRQDLDARFGEFVDEAFRYRVLPFDEKDAREFADLFALRRSAGRPISFPDGQIAAIARRHRMAVATRNVSDFERCGIEVINPYSI